MNQALPIQRNAADTRPRYADRIAGFFIPLCLFVEPANFFMLTTAEFYEVDRFAVPISLILSPFFLLFVFNSRFHQYFRGGLFLFLVVIFCLYCLVMGALNAVMRSPDAILFAYQWIIPFVWIPYFLTIMGTERFKTFMRWFLIGVIANIGWYGASTIIEFVAYGGLGDAGRLSQNRILPGQYQIAVYVPTAISFGMSLLNAMFFSKELNVSRKFMLIINGGALIVLLALASREGLLTYMLATILLFAARSPYLRAALFFGGFIAGAMLIINLNAIFEVFAASDFRMLNKIASLQNEGAQFGGRDIMIRESIKVFFWDPLFGSGFLPPNVSVFGDGILAPSAHNMYVDAFVWCGLFGGLAFLAISIRLLYGAVMMIVSRRLKEEHLYLSLFGVVLMVFMVVSNNLNVPMRQPIISPLIGLMIAAVIYHAMLRRKARR